MLQILRLTRATALWSPSSRRIWEISSCLQAERAALRTDEAAQWAAEIIVWARRLASTGDKLDHRKLCSVGFIASELKLSKPALWLQWRSSAPWRSHSKYKSLSTHLFYTTIDWRVIAFAYTLVDRCIATNFLVLHITAKVRLNANCKVHPSAYHCKALAS